MQSMPGTAHTAGVRHSGQPAESPQQRASSVPVQPDRSSSTSAYSLSQTESQIWEACRLDPIGKDHKQASSSTVCQACELPSISGRQTAPELLSMQRRSPAAKAGSGMAFVDTEAVQEAASPQPVLRSRSQQWPHQRSLSPDEPTYPSPKAAAAQVSPTPPLLPRANRAVDLAATRSGSLPPHTWCVPKSVSRTTPKQASPELQAAASGPAAGFNAEVLLGLAPRAMSSPPGEGVLGVDDRVGEGTTGNGRADAWAFPAGDPLARKAFSSGTAATEPIPKKRKTSDSGAAQDVTVFTHPAENGGGGAASIPDSQRVPGSGGAPSIPLSAHPVGLSRNMPDAAHLGRPSVLKLLSAGRDMSPQNAFKASTFSSSASQSPVVSPTGVTTLPFRKGSLPIGASLLPTRRSSLPAGVSTLPTGKGSLPTAEASLPSNGAGSFGPAGDVFSAFASLSSALSPQQLQEFLHTLQASDKSDIRARVAEELSRHMQPSSYSKPLAQGVRPKQHGWSTAVETVPQLHSAAVIEELAVGSSPSLFPPLIAPSVLPLPKKTAKKRKSSLKPDMSAASLAASIDNLHGASLHGPSSFSTRISSGSFSAAGLKTPSGSFSAAGLTAPAGSVSAAGHTASIPLAAFGNSAVRVAQGPGMAGGIKHTPPSLGSLSSFTPDLAASAPGPVNAALELSLLLTTLQSLANLPEGDGQPHNTIASSSHLAQAQLRDWLAQLQQHATTVSNEPSTAQQAQEDAGIAGQVRGEMWGNLQGILSMAGQGCSPHVQDMIHQIAVHFANEQSQSVALERRLTGNITKEKEAQRRMQQQLQGGIQVLTAVQRVLGAVRMQQQRDATRTVGVQHPESPDFGRASSAWRVVEAERGERAAQQAVKPLQKKGTVWEAELGAAQTSNAQLHQQVSELLRETAALEKQSRQYLQEKDMLNQRVTGMQSEKEAVTDQLSSSNAERDWLSEHLGISVAKTRSISEENSMLKKQLKALQAGNGNSSGQ